MATNVAIRGLSGRGFRVPNSAASYAWTTCKEGVGVQVDLDDETTRLILSRERDNFVRVTNTGTTTAYLVGLSRRGFRVKNNAGAQAQIVQGASIQVSLDDGSAKRTLKRQKRDFIRVPSTWTAGATVSVYGIQESQAAFRVINPAATFIFAGANNDLTFTPKNDAPGDMTIELADLGVDNATIDITNTLDAYQISLAVTQAKAATAILNSTGTAPSDGATVVVNDRTYTWKTALTPTAGQVLIGASSNTALDNLVAAVNGAAGAGTTYATGTLKPTDVTAGARSGTGASATVTFTASTVGTGGNAYASTETSTQNAFTNGATFTGGVNYSIDSTAADVATAVAAASPGLGDLVTVTYEGTGAGTVGVAAATALEGNDPLPLAKGDTAIVDLGDPFNLAQLRRHFRAWVEA